MWPPEVTLYISQLRSNATTALDPYIERRFTSAEKWHDLSVDEGYRFRGVFRDSELDLGEILKHSQTAASRETPAGP